MTRNSELKRLLNRNFSKMQRIERMLLDSTDQEKPKFRKGELVTYSSLDFPDGYTYNGKVLRVEKCYGNRLDTGDLYSYFMYHVLIGSKVHEIEGDYLKKK